MSFLVYSCLKLSFSKSCRPVTEMIFSLISIHSFHWPFLSSPAIPLNSCQFMSRPSCVKTDLTFFRLAKKLRRLLEHHPHPHPILVNLDHRPHLKFPPRPIPQTEMVPIRTKMATKKRLPVSR